MAPIKMFGPKAAFPRPGAWTKLSDGRLGIIFKINKINVEDPTSPGETIEQQEAQVHLVDSSRNTIGEVKLPADSLVQATYDDIKSQLPTDHSMFEVAKNGYALTESQVRSLSALQRARLGRSLDDADKAQALIEESQEHLQVLKIQRVQSDPRAIALEEEIEKERVEFIAKQAARRQAMFDEITKDMGG